MRLNMRQRVWGNASLTYAVSAFGLTKMSSTLDPKPAGRILGKPIMAIFSKEIFRDFGATVT